jgi:hypothetical protein
MNWKPPKRSQEYLVGGIPTPLKNMRTSVGMMTFPTELKNMFQTTNQFSLYRSYILDYQS